MDPSTDNASDVSKKKISLSFTPTKLQSNLNNLLANEINILPDKCPDSPPQATDHFLNIIPKPTLLGKQQAKKRLQAFGLGKFLSPSSPVLKKTVQNVKQVKSIEISEEKFDENGKKIEEISIVKKPPKKSDDYQKKAKGIIEEIENLKKISLVRLGANVKYLRRSRSKSPKEHKKDMDSKGSSRKHSEERKRYPADWGEMKIRKLSLEDVKDIEKPKRTSKSSDAIKMLSFPTPPIQFNHLKYKSLSGKDDAFIPPSFIRYTKATPKISYSCNYNRIKSVFYSRKQILDVISKEQKKSLKQFISASCKDIPDLPTSPMKVQQWYSKSILSLGTESELVETSLGLKILQEYGCDEEGQKNEPGEAEKLKLKINKKEERNKKKLKKAQKKLNKLKKKKKKKKHQSSSSSNSESEEEENKLTELFPKIEQECSKNVHSKDPQIKTDHGNSLNSDVPSQEKKVDINLYDILNESEKSNHSDIHETVETITPKGIEIGNANFTNFLIKTSILKGTERAKIESCNSLLHNPKPFISSDIDFKKIYSISTEIKLQNDLAATKILKSTESTNLQRVEDDSYKSQEEKSAILNSLKVYSDADIESERRRLSDLKHRRDDDKYRKGDDRYRKDDRHRRDDDKYQKDDDRYRRDDGKYRKDDDKYKRDDDRYKRDDDRYKRDDDRYKKDDDRHRRDDDRHRRDDDRHRKDDDRHRRDDKFKKDEERNRRDDDRIKKDDDRIKKDDSRHRREDDKRDEDKSKKYDDKHKMDNRKREQDKFKKDDKYKKDDKRKDDYKDRKEDSKNKYDDKVKKDDKYTKEGEYKNRKEDGKGSKDDKKIDTKSKKEEEKPKKDDDKSKKIEKDDDKNRRVDKDDDKSKRIEKDDDIIKRKGKDDDKNKRIENDDDKSKRIEKDDDKSNTIEKDDDKSKRIEKDEKAKADKSKIDEHLRIFDKYKNHDTTIKYEAEKHKQDDRSKKDEKLSKTDDKNKSDSHATDNLHESDRKSNDDKFRRNSRSEDKEVKHKSYSKKNESSKKCRDSIVDDISIKIEPMVEINLKNVEIFENETYSIAKMEDIRNDTRRSSSIDIHERKRKSSKSLSPKCSKSRSRSESLTKESTFEIKSSNKRSLVTKKTRHRKADETGTPDTEEYHSHWESEEESESPCKKLKNNSWESDEEQHELDQSDRVTQHKNSDLMERSLEMPLNININRSREKYRRVSPEEYKPALFEDIEHKPNYTLYSDGWERGKYLKFRNDLEIQALEEERRSISEERKKLELEKQRIAEMGRRLRTGEICDEAILPVVKVEPNIEEQKSILNEDDSPGFLGVCKSSVSYSNKKLQSNRLEKSKEDKLKKEDDVSKVVEKTNALEDEYEQFMKAVTDNIDVPSTKLVPEPSDKYNSCTSTSDYSESSSSNSSSSNSSSDSADNKTANVEKFIPLPVPSPLHSRNIVYGKDFSGTIQRLTNADSTSSPTKVIDILNNDTNLECSSRIDLENRKPITTIILSKRPSQLLENSVFKDSDDSDNEKNKIANNDVIKPTEEPTPKRQLSKSPPKIRSSKDSDDSFNYRRESSPKRRRNSPGRRNLSPRRSRSPGRGSPSRGHYSPNRSHHSPSRGHYSPNRRHHSPQRGHSPRNYSPSRKRRDSPRRRYKDSPSRRRYSPRRGRDSSPRYREHARNRSLSPYRRRYSRSLSKERKTGNIQQTLQRIAGMDQFDNINKSPVNSPLDGFKRSIADSTISDEQLLQNQEQYIDTISPFYNNSLHKPDVVTSPKRIPLDDRINQVLGIEKEEPKPISTTYSQDYAYNPQYYSQYEQYNMDYEHKAYQFSYDPKIPPTKVVQVGNVLQVVPAEDINTIVPETVPKEVETTQRILQVGNMLQIVPTTLPVVEPVPAPVAPVKEKQSAEDLMKEKIAERKAEREKRRLEREKRRKEKEKKRKEREKKKQIKLKMKTEDMIKKALYTELNQDEDDEDAQEAKFQWPPVPALSGVSKPVGKSILIQRRKDAEDEVVIERPKKGVKFADGVIPGEGTSPSGGEELSSPPPVPANMPKEKRFTKTKKPKKIKLPKKKNKSKMRQLKRRQETDDEEEDFLPPPSPPPGSPPPHIFPPRIKPMNNLKPNFLAQSRPVNFQFPPLNCRPPPIPDALQQPPPSMTCRPPLITDVLQQPPAMTCRPPPMPEALQQPPPFMLHPQNIQPSHQGVSAHHSIPPPHHRLSQSKPSYNVSISPSNPHHHHGAHHG